MQDLKLVGVHEDGEHLVLSAPDGQKYLLLVDDPLRAAIRLDRARLGQLQIQSEGRLRPREIQARIRAGQTAEEVAAASGLPVEFVRRFEGPVLAEREFVVRQAQAVRVRGGARGASASLGEIVGERLAARDVDESLQLWDAWRGDDGVWVVALTFTAGGRERQARWSYDAQLRHVTPRDDEARWLTEDDAEEPGQQRPRRLTPVGTSGRRDPELPGDVPARDRVYDVEADGAIRPVDEPRPATAHAASNATVYLLDSLRERRGRRQRVGVPDDPFGPPGSDPMDAAFHASPGPRPLTRTPSVEDLPAAHPPVSRPDLAADAEVLSLADLEGAGPLDPYDGFPLPPGPPEGEPGPATGPVAGGGTPAPDEPQAPEAETPERPASRRARRASVPKWDDIVFGSRRE